MLGATGVTSGIRIESNILARDQVAGQDEETQVVSTVWCENDACWMLVLFPYAVVIRCFFLTTALFSCL